MRLLSAKLLSYQCFSCDLLDIYQSTIGLATRQSIADQQSNTVTYQTLKQMSHLMRKPANVMSTTKVQIIAFVANCLDGTISLLSVSVLSSLQLISEAEHLFVGFNAI